MKTDLHGTWFSISACWPYTREQLHPSLLVEDRLINPMALHLLSPICPGEGVNRGNASCGTLISSSRRPYSVSTTFLIPSPMFISAAW